jgi:uncharacterized membrane protein
MGRRRIGAGLFMAHAGGDMDHAENSISVQEPVNEVFQFILNGENNKSWRDSVIEISRATNGPDGVGSRFAQVMRGPCGRRIKGDYEITECEKDKVISFQVTRGPARPVGTYRFDREGSGTKVTFVLRYEPKGFARLMDSMVSKSMQIEVGRLSSLKSYLESKK